MAGTGRSRGPGRVRWARGDRATAGRARGAKRLVRPGLVTERTIRILQEPGRAPDFPGFRGGCTKFDLRRSAGKSVQDGRGPALRVEAPTLEGRVAARSRGSAPKAGSGRERRARFPPERPGPSAGPAARRSWLHPGAASGGGTAEVVRRVSCGTSFSGELNRTHEEPLPGRAVGVSLLAAALLGHPLSPSRPPSRDTPSTTSIPRPSAQPSARWRMAAT